MASSRKGKIKEEQDKKVLVFNNYQLVKGSFTNKKGEQQPKFDLIGPKDDDGFDQMYSMFSATLAEEIEKYKETDTPIKIQLEKNRGGYWQIKNVAREGEEFPVRESKSRFQKNYDLEARAAATQAYANLNAGNGFKLDQFLFDVEIIAEYIKNGTADIKDQNQIQS